MCWMKFFRIPFTKCNTLFKILNYTYKNASNMFAKHIILKSFKGFLLLLEQDPKTLHKSWQSSSWANLPFQLPSSSIPHGTFSEVTCFFYICEASSYLQVLFIPTVWNCHPLSPLGILCILYVLSFKKIILRSMPWFSLVPRLDAS